MIGASRESDNRFIPGPDPSSKSARPASADDEPSGYAEIFPIQTGA
jgi:hypothetical protein